MKFTLPALFTLLAVATALPVQVSQQQFEKRTPQTEGFESGKDIGSGIGGASSKPAGGIGSGTGGITAGVIAVGAAQNEAKKKELEAEAQTAEAEAQRAEAARKQAEETAEALKKQQQEMLDIIKNINNKISEAQQQETDNFRGLSRSF